MVNLNKKQSVKSNQLRKILGAKFTLKETFLGLKNRKSLKIGEKSQEDRQEKCLLGRIWDMNSPSILLIGLHFTHSS